MDARKAGGRSRVSQQQTPRSSLSVTPNSSGTVTPTGDATMDPNQQVSICVWVLILSVSPTYLRAQRAVRGGRGAPMIVHSVLLCSARTVSFLCWLEECAERWCQS